MLSSVLKFRWSKNFVSVLFTIFFGLLVAATPAVAQSTATLQGTITDTSNAAVPNAKVLVHNQATGVERTTQTDQSGAYLVAGLLPGLYTVTVSSSGFQTFVIRDLKLDVATAATENAELKVGQVTQEVIVSGGAPLVNTSTPAVGQVINQTTVQQIPLNGRHFVDLGLLVPGTVTPPQNGFLTAPLRGQGSFAINTAGQREDTTNWLLNGINLSDEVQNQITFQPSIDTVSEFKIDNSTFPAEYGRNSGAIVNIATRSGANDLHGEAFDFLRNNFLDARNFFNFKPQPQAPLIRNDFGADAGGAIKKNKAFFFGSYEGLRQHQAISTISTVLTAADRAQVAASSDAAIQALTAVIPQANSGANTFLGASVANVQIDQGAGDLDFVVGPNDRLHGYYALQEDVRQEPTLQYIQNNALPGWGDTRSARRQIMTVEEDHIFGPTLSNEARLGYNRVAIHFTPNQLLKPTDFSISDGITAAIGIPQFSIGGSALQFGGPGGFPQGRGDLTAVGSDTVRYIRGNHTMALGGEIRRFYNNNFNLDAGNVSFAGIPQFIADQPSSFIINLSNGASKLLEPSWGIFAQDAYKLRPNLTLNLGLRYDYNYAISDAQDRFVEFDPATAELIQVGTNGFDQPFQSDAKLVQPRVGVAWDPWGDGKTSVRLGYAILADQPVTNIVTGQTTNPPFGDPLNVNSAQAPTLALTNAAAVAGPAGLAPSTIFRGFRSPYVQSYNFTIQREITPSLGVQVGYIGSKGTHLRLARNLNQPAIGQEIEGPKKLKPTVPFSAVSASSPIAAGRNLGNITEADSSGNSNYNALWISANKHFAQGLQFNASYTYSKSLDYNSLSSQGVVLEDSTNPRLNYGPSDFDARNRVVISGVYDLPFKGNRLISGWEISGISQAQSGNPLTVVLNDSGPTGNFTLRPDLTGPVQIGQGAPTKGLGVQWIENPSVFSSPSVTGPNGGNIYHFGNLGRNSIIGPSFVNTDFSLIKRTKINERFGTEFRAEFFDIFNHPNFGDPNLRFGASTFGLITSTRFPTGDFGSARQIQLALKLTF